MIALAGLTSACAGAPVKPDADGSGQEPRAANVQETPAQKCLAIAGAARDRKPNEPAKVGVRHVLVKYQGAKNAAETITRSREDACLRAMEARDKILAGADFDEIVKTYSDEAGAADRRGSLGVLERQEMAPPFADAAMELTVGQMSDVVETAFGFHLILRNE